MASENVSDLIDEASACLAGFFAKRRQSSIRLIGAAGDVDLSQAADRFACQEAISVDP